MVTEISIRQAGTEDVAAILALYRETRIERGAGFTVEEAAAKLASLDVYPNYRIFVAVLDGKIVGTYALLIMDNLAKRGRGSGIVENVCVSPGKQGKGIGRAMMKDAMERCREAACYKLALSSNLERNEAHDFYKALDLRVMVTVLLSLSIKQETTWET